MHRNIGFSNPSIVQTVYSKSKNADLNSNVISFGKGKSEQLAVEKVVDQLSLISGEPPTITPRAQSRIKSFAKAIGLALGLVGAGAVGLKGPEIAHVVSAKAEVVAAKVGEKMLQSAGHSERIDRTIAEAGFGF